MQILNQLGKAALELTITIMIAVILAGIAYGITGGGLSL